ncbi:hypothetical protein L3Q82_019363 [Scortum barcoo]|uniref:Uncharacterized protein n=1 Tax=Scortum barcoo TaxID=214431 RepID=A0ACB8VBN5_9TELE|nr:hypothetical protein L3Q82_019363 [Scortum barcoo]
MSKNAEHEEVVVDFDQGHLYAAVVCSETRLKRFIELMVGRADGVRWQLLFQDITEKGEISGSGSQSCHLQKFSDDSEYRSVVDKFVEWCGLNHLQLSVTKTKELVVDFRKQRTRLNSVAIRGYRSGHCGQLQVPRVSTWTIN